MQRVAPWLRRGAAVAVGAALVLGALLVSVAVAAALLLRAVLPGRRRAVAPPPVRAAGDVIDVEVREVVELRR